MPEPKIAEELRGMRHEPLLPVEKKLIVWSILLGLFFIAFLTGIRHWLFGG
jgi:hypothetical protein